jgi:hypothetical protein
VLLLGPDNFSNFKELRRDIFYCDKMLVSTAARTPSDYNLITGPHKLGNCTIWRPVTTIERKTQPTTESLLWLYPEEEAPVFTSQNHPTQIWECHAHGDVELTARYLYIPSTLPEHSSTELVSATKIHATIKTTTKAESTAYIEKYALDPTYLKQQLVRRDDGSHEEQQELLKAEKALNHFTFEEIVAERAKYCRCRRFVCNGPCLYSRKNRPEEHRRIHAQDRAELQSRREECNPPTFPFGLESDIMGKRYASIGTKSTKENVHPTDEDEEDEDELQTDEGDLSFEETMQLRVPTKKEKIPVHKPEYGNANAWPPA